MRRSSVSGQPAVSSRMPGQDGGGDAWVAGRAAWLAVAALTLVVFVVNLPGEFAAFQRVCSGLACAPDDLTLAQVNELQSLGLSVSFFAALFLGAEVVFVAIWNAVAATIFWRKSTDRAALFVALFLTTFSVGIFLSGAADRAAGTPLGWLTQALIALGWMNFFLFFLVFPDGRVQPRIARFVVPVLVVLLAGATFWPNMPVFLWLNPLRLVSFLVLVLGGVAAQVFRYVRVSTPQQRQQTRLVVASVCGAIVIVALAQIVPVVLHTSSALAMLTVYLVVYVALLLIPLAIGVAILRYQLWSIHLLVNRALAGGILTLFVVGSYVLLVGAANAFLARTGALAQFGVVPQLVVTGLIALIFQPLRERVQRGVNRLVYGEHGDPYLVLSQLVRRLESNLAPETLLPTIVETVAQALRSPYVAILLDQNGMVATAAAVGNPVPGTLRFPLVYGNVPLGVLVLASRGQSEPLSRAEQRLLHDLVAQASSAVHSVRLTTELQQLTIDLQQSRERLVSASEEERRRLRRDLHDGVGPTLASLAQRIELAQRLVARDPDEAVAMLGELRAQVRATVSDIRRVVYALRPPVLDELGLISAVREFVVQQNQSGATTVVVDAPPQMPTLSAAAEVAAYRILAEAITNVLRHANASECRVRIAVKNHTTLLLEIADNGVGLLPERRPGVGLQSMRERVAELGGTLRIDSAAGGGTRVRAHIPASDGKRTLADREI